MGSVVCLFVLLTFLGLILEKKSKSESKIIKFLANNQLIFLIIAGVLAIVHCIMAEAMVIMGTITFLLILLTLVNMYFGRKNKEFVNNWILLSLIVISAIIHVILL